MAKTVTSGLSDLALTWSGRALDVGRIEDELTRLRYLVAGEASGGHGFAVRASTLNMVVYAEHQDGAHHSSRVIQDLASHHPSRAIIVVARHGGEPKVEAELAAHCHVNPNLEQNICCEEVTLHVSGPPAAHLHSIIIPLLVPDLPVYVWWTEPLPADPHLIREMLGIADRFIVDSERFDDQLAGLLRLAALGDAQPDTALGDLAWDRMAVWRDLVDRQLQVSQVAHHLEAAESVEIRYAGPAAGAPGKPGQAFLFLAWLASRLGWDTRSVAGHGRERLTLRHYERKAPVYLHAVSYPAVDSGSLVAVKIACKSAAGSALVTLARTGDPYHVTVRSEHRGDVAEDHVRIDPPQPAAMLMRELNAPLRDSDFGRVLRLTLPLIQAARA